MRVTITAVSDVALGTGAAAADRRLTQLIGTPVRRDLPGCNGERGHTLQWGRLVVYISDDAEGGGVLLRGWEVTNTESGPRVALPYETAVGQSAAEVRAKVPDAKAETFTEGPYTGLYVIATRRAPGLFWTAKTATGLVNRAAYRTDECD